MASAAVESTAQQTDATRPYDDLTDLLDYEANLKALQAQQQPKGDDVYDEVKIRKKRAPIAKLDEERLLGQNGISKLRHKMAKGQFKFKGKGHEFQDVARLLSVYQHWLDDMFPKANFADGLAIIEKLGHKRRMQVMRQAWIDESKGKVANSDSDGELGTEDVVQGDDAAFVEDESDEDAMFVRDRSHKQPDDDDAIPAEPSLEELYAQPTISRGVVTSTRVEEAHTDQPPMDELDMLLAEDQAVPTTQAPVREEDDFADDEEAMQGVW